MKGISVNSTFYGIYNMCNGIPVRLMNFIKALETEVIIKTVKGGLIMQTNDVLMDTTKLKSNSDYEVLTSVDQGVESSFSWYRYFYNVE